MIAYLNSVYAEADKICLSPDDRGFLLADGLYEVVRFYEGKPFKLKEHQARLESGAKSLRFERTHFPEFEEILWELVKRNNLLNEKSCTVYFQLTRGVAPRAHRFPAPGTPLTIYAAAKPFSRNTDEIERGAKAITIADDRWARCDIKSIALLPNTLAHQTARDNQSIEAFFIRNGQLQEGTHSNVMICKKGVVKTAPLSNTILAGITRNTVLKLCRDLSIPMQEALISQQEIYQADEVFIVGTTVEITPIIQLDDQIIGQGVPGEITKKLQNQFFKSIAQV